jgi:hypothetical protein
MSLKCTNFPEIFMKYKNVILDRTFKLTKNDGLDMFDENLFGHARGTVQHDMLHYLSI